MPGKTQNYQLNQWVGSDPFLRTDFNEDNARIDAALAAKADQTTVTSLTNTVSTKADKTTVNSLTNTVNTKADQTTVTNLSNTVTSLTNTVNTKADKTTVTSLTNTVNTKASQTALDALSATVAAKCELVFGTYTGDGTTTRSFNLGFAPKAVFVCSQEGVAGYLWEKIGSYGGLALPGAPLTMGDSVFLTVTNTGFQINVPDYHVRINENGNVYRYFAVR